jgi:hypothetical protein
MPVILCLLIYVEWTYKLDFKLELSCTSTVVLLQTALQPS